MKAPIGFRIIGWILILVLLNTVRFLCQNPQYSSLSGYTFDFYDILGLLSVVLPVWIFVPAALFGKLVKPWGKLYIWAKGINISFWLK